MKAKSESYPPAETAAPSGEPRDQVYHYTSSIRIFHLKKDGPILLTSGSMLPMPEDEEIPGFLCQAARQLLNISQQTLHERAGVSKKTINDFENLFVAPQLETNRKIRQELERQGARFLIGSERTGVVILNEPLPAPRSKTRD
ncbi:MULTISPECIES: helix-turn-helix transcriptional regulator [unclassified Bosea (in: a-proteobacteria)]|uniref:helix-turn-helix domain-containing protein n=1 Tax=unclassified Bosea (in: a-proteobacteria) TaxID=2653178 RepID=UPI000B7939F7|nr:MULTISPECIES: helix-turn-helix transcriptional regulator [unclassified Bosea (in: a-proteobacteria)]MBN9459519.1 helix-turn-helix transcriptional regulator [Bosea sp. (in: a-proteobacteria)]TAJ29344.1 MAG: XRE family transcriptional regulator [Bosea sp. (in: a-proteobacteria)]